MNSSSADDPSLPRISVVTPSFNQGEFLEECIESILGQGYPNLEYVIMDGGSTDNSVQIIKKYEKYLTYWQSRPDGGQYAAVNAGFRKTSGAIMAWLNSDDKYHDRSLCTVAYVFGVHHEVEWIMGRPTFWDGEGEIIRIEHCLPTHSRLDFLEKKYNNPFVQQESTFWRRSLWERAGGCVRDDLEYAGDLELWVRFLRFAELYTVDAILGGYRSHGNQKAFLGMDRYVSEAEAVLDEELRQVARETSPKMNQAPTPLTINLVDMRAYLSRLGIVPGSFFQVYQYLFTTFKKPQIEVLEVQLQETEARLAAIEGSLTWRSAQFLKHHFERLKKFVS